jgi:PAS domain-containing protein
VDILAKSQDYHKTHKTTLNRAFQTILLVTFKRSLYYQWCLLTDSRWLKPLFLRSFSKVCGLLEMLLTHTNLFSPLNLKHRIFSKVSTANLRDRLLVLVQAGDEEASSRLSKHIRLRELAFDLAPIAQIVVDKNGFLVLLNDQARSLFGLSTKDLSRPFQDLEISYRPTELRSLIERAYTERCPVSINNVERYLSNAEIQYFDVRIVPLLDNGTVPQGFSAFSLKMGIFRVSVRSFKTAMTSQPFIPDISKSSKITSGCCANATAIAFSPESTVITR